MVLLGAAIPLPVVPTLHFQIVSVCPTSSVLAFRRASPLSLHRLFVLLGCLATASPPTSRSTGGPGFPRRYQAAVDFPSISPLRGMPYFFCTCLSSGLLTFPAPALCFAGMPGYSVASGVPFHGRPRLSSPLPGRNRFPLRLPSPGYALLLLYLPFVGPPHFPCTGPLFCWDVWLLRCLRRFVPRGAPAFLAATRPQSIFPPSPLSRVCPTSSVLAFSSGLSTSCTGSLFCWDIWLQRRLRRPVPREALACPAATRPQSISPPSPLSSLHLNYSPAILYQVSGPFISILHFSMSSAHCIHRLVSLIINYFLGALFFKCLTLLLRAFYAASDTMTYQSPRLASPSSGRKHRHLLSPVFALPTRVFSFLRNLISFCSLRPSFPSPGALSFCGPLSFTFSPAAPYQPLCVLPVWRAICSSGPSARHTTSSSPAGALLFYVFYLSGADASHHFRRSGPPTVPACLVVSRPRSFVSPFLTSRYDESFAFLSLQPSRFLLN